MPLPLNLEDLGRRARSMRLAKGLTLEEVVARAEFTISWLSKLENGQLTPSLEGLVRLAQVLECGVEELVEGLSARPHHVVVKKGKGRVEAVRERGVEIRLEHLADSWRGRSMHPTILHISGAGGRPPASHNEGERFLLVLDGGVRLEYGSESIPLATGDSIYIDATVPHAIVPTSRTKARVLCVSLDGGGSAAGRPGDGRPRAKRIAPKRTATRATTRGLEAPDR